tara:strand:+ start:2307 stop:2585 length:279 start_codon:yes stop_codon:yes gene_type:complete
MNTDEYVIRAKSEGYHGNDLVFWRVGGGYTSKLDKAERFTKEEALNAHTNRASDLPMLYDVLNEIARKTVDMQLLPTYEEELSVLHMKIAKE